MTQEEMLEKLFEEVKFRILSLQTDVTFNVIKQSFIECLNEMEYVILPKNIEAMSERNQDFERIIAQNIATGSDVDPSEVYGTSIMRQLASEGWLVIPPI